MQAFGSTRMMSGDTAADYNAIACSYARHLSDELIGKPFDRALLDAFACRWSGCGLIGDLGCGPGHVTAYFKATGLSVEGVDSSAGMVAEASRAHPGIPFRLEDIRLLDSNPTRYAACLALYALLHFDDTDLLRALKAIRHAMIPGGELVAAVHLGTGLLAPGEMWGTSVSLQFRMFEVGELEAALATVGFTVVEVLERDPYPDVEYPSRRLYVRARA